MVAGQFQREISAERVARHDDAVDAIAVGELADDVIGIRSEPRMIETARVRLGAATVALVQQDHVEPGGETLVAESAHVVRLTRTLETMQSQQRRMASTVGLPMTVRQDA